jgi:hypothetical protein
MTLSEGDHVRATWHNTIEGGQFHGKQIKEEFTGTVQCEPFRMGPLKMKYRVNVQKDDSQKVFTVHPSNCEKIGSD